MGWINDNVNLDVANFLFNIKITCLPDRIGVFQRDVRPDVTIDFEFLEEQLAQTPEMICFWDMLLAEQKAKVASLESRKDFIRGEITDRILTDCRDKKIEVRRADIEDLIKQDQDYVDHTVKLIQETRVENKLRAVISALQRKSDHLRSLSGFKKEEKRNP